MFDYNYIYIKLMDDLKNKKKHNDKRRDIPWNVKFTQRYVVEFDSLQHKIDDDEA